MQAAYWSIFLNVTHIFGLFDLILPLILQDKVSLAEEFLKVAEEQQLTTVQFLDGLLDRKKTVYENCDEILRYLHVNKLIFILLNIISLAVNINIPILNITYLVTVPCQSWLHV